MTRRMKDEAFRQSQLRQPYAAHVKALNKLVDELRVPGERWMPHVAPLQGGTAARLLLLGAGSGPASGDPYEALLSVEDDNAESARLSSLLAKAGIGAGDALLWNACPWYAPTEPDSAAIKDGVEPLRRVLLLLDELVVVILLGPVAERSWRMLASTSPADVPPATVLATAGVGDSDFGGTNAQRQQQREHQSGVFLEAAGLLRRD